MQADRPCLLCIICKLTCIFFHGILQLILHELLHCRVGLGHWEALDFWQTVNQIWPCSQMAKVRQMCRTLQPLNIMLCLDAEHHYI